MQNFLTLTVAALSLVQGGRQDALEQNIRSSYADIKIGKTIQVTQEQRPSFSNVICNFSITQNSSNHDTAILAGKVVSDNSGAGQEFVPIFFGSPLTPPRLAALTNAAGEFRFTVRLADPKRLGSDIGVEGLAINGMTASGVGGMRLRTVKLEEATLYLGGRFDKDTAMLSGRTYLYSLRNFLEAQAKKRP